MIGQGLRSNPQGLALPDHPRLHTLLRPVGKVAGMELTVRRWCALPLVDEGMVLVCVLGFDLFRLCM